MDDALRLASILRHRLPSIECLEKAANKLVQLSELADKYKWQVRDTCARAEKAEAEVERLRVDAERWRYVQRNPWRAIDLLTAGCRFSPARWRDEANAAIDTAMREGR